MRLAPYKLIGLSHITVDGETFSAHVFLADGCPGLKRCEHCGDATGWMICDGSLLSAMFNEQPKRGLILSSFQDIL